MNRVPIELYNLLTEQGDFNGISCLNVLHGHAKAMSERDVQIAVTMLKDTRAITPSNVMVKGTAPYLTPQFEKLMHRLRALQYLNAHYPSQPFILARLSLLFVAINASLPFKQRLQTQGIPYECFLQTEAACAKYAIQMDPSFFKRYHQAMEEAWKQLEALYTYVAAHDRLQVAQAEPTNRDRIRRAVTCVPPANTPLWANLANKNASKLQQDWALIEKQVNEMNYAKVVRHLLGEQATIHTAGDYMAARIWLLQDFQRHARSKSDHAFSMQQSADDVSHAFTYLMKEFKLAIQSTSRFERFIVQLASLASASTLMFSEESMPANALEQVSQNELKQSNPLDVLLQRSEALRQGKPTLAKMNEINDLMNQFAISDEIEKCHKDEALSQLRVLEGKSATMDANHSLEHVASLKPVFIGLRKWPMRGDNIKNGAMTESLHYQDQSNIRANLDKFRQHAQNLLESLAKSKEGESRIVRAYRAASYIYCGIVTIHPLLDCNGRVATLLGSMPLLFNNLPPLIRCKPEAMKQALLVAQTTPLAEYNKLGFPAMREVADLFMSETLKNLTEMKRGIRQVLNP